MVDSEDVSCYTVCPLFLSGLALLACVCLFLLICKDSCGKSQRTNEGVWVWEQSRDGTFLVGRKSRWCPGEAEDQTPSQTVWSHPLGGDKNRDSGALLAASAFPSLSC